MVECYNLSIELFFRKKDARINYEEIDFFSYLIKSRDMKNSKKVYLIGSLFKILYNTIISSFWLTIEWFKMYYFNPMLK